MASSSHGTNPNQLMPLREVGNDPPNYQSYPPPMAEYSEVVANPTLFMSTLQKLHSTMRTKFMIPVIGGKELDLHHLFVEVTHRGGIDKILKERRWKDVTATFNFPSTATNASFVLRKHYESLLQHYEQIYYFKARGYTKLTYISSVSGSIPGPPIPTIPYQRIEPAVPTQPPLPPEPPRATATTSALPVGTPVMGVVDGKIEGGYSVTVTIGSEILKGVLYDLPSLFNPSQSQTQVQRPFGFLKVHSTSAAAATVGVQKRHRREKFEIRWRDPSRPKTNLSPFNFFFKDQFARLELLHPGKNKEIGRMIGDLWNNLLESQKSVYRELAAKDKERYKREMESYTKSLNNPVIGYAVPLQRRRIEDMVMEEGEDDDEDSSQTPYETSSDEDSSPPWHGAFVGESSNYNAETNEETRNIPSNEEVTVADTTEQGH